MRFGCRLRKTFLCSRQQAEPCSPTTVSGPSQGGSGQVTQSGDRGTAEGRRSRGDGRCGHGHRPGRLRLPQAACTDRIAFGPLAGQKMLTVQGAERGHGTAPAGGPVPREGLALASASAACKACPGMPTSIGCCAPTSTVSASRLVSPHPARCRALLRQALPAAVTGPSTPNRSQPASKDRFMALRARLQSLDEL